MNYAAHFTSNQRIHSVNLCHSRHFIQHVLWPMVFETVVDILRVYDDQIGICGFEMIEYCDNCLYLPPPPCPTTTASNGHFLFGPYFLKT